MRARTFTSQPDGIAKAYDMVWVPELQLPTTLGEQVGPPRAARLQPFSQPHPAPEGPSTPVIQVCADNIHGNSTEKRPHHFTLQRSTNGKFEA
jgi:hypothetical protein